MVELSNLCAGKGPVKELDAARAEQVKLFELTECPVANDVKDVFVFGGWLYALHADGSLVDHNGKTVDFPPVECAKSPFLTASCLVRGRDGDLYDHNRKVQTAEALRWYPSSEYRIRKDGDGYCLLDNFDEPFRIPLAMLKDIDPKNVKRAKRKGSGRGTNLYWTREHPDWYKELIDAKSEKILLGCDGSCLFVWNGLVYLLDYVNPSRGGLNEYLDPIYTEEYDVDDIASLVTERIYLSRKGELVFLDGWNEDSSFAEAAIRAKKWKDLVQCERIHANGKYHLVAKTKDGRIVSTFEPELSGNLKNIDHAFVTEDWAIFVV